jgi:predicted O-linked N-acetylglucosamine transferase (SPINDLY family)
LHDKNQFEIYIYSTFNAIEKEHVRLTVEKHCDVFRDMSLHNDAAVAQQIHQDEIDILVDFNGYTAKSRSCVMAMRPAPIQVLYLAYLQSMGAEFIDYAILDKTVCPLNLEQDWQEKVAKLPHSLYLYDTETPNTPSHQSRADYGLPQNAFVFCCLNIPYKIEPEIFDVWMDIMHAVPHSVLWLLGNDVLTVQHLTGEAAKRNILADRLVFAEPLPHAEHLQRYQQADLFIDTFWCGAHTTALDALWQGLPVLSCITDISTARVGASLLEVLEMPELVATDFEQYREIAIYYANHPDAMSALKKKLAEKKSVTPLFDIPRTVKHIEKAYHLMWQRHIQGLAPATFDVPEETEF